MGAIWVRDRAVTLADGTRRALGDLLGPGTHGTTFGGNPLGCAVAWKHSRPSRTRDCSRTRATSGSARQRRYRKRWRPR